jgi:signal transduction histidine kinase
MGISVHAASAVRAAVALGVGACGGWAYARAGASGTDVLADLAVGWAFAISGLVAWYVRPYNRTGPLMYAEGLTWFIGNFQGTGAPVLVGMAMWLEGLNLAVLAHLVLTFPEGRLTTRLTRLTVAGAYGLAVVGGLLRAATYDPSVNGAASFYACGDCRPNPLLVISDRTLFEIIDLEYWWIGDLITVTCVLVIVRRWLVSSKPRRHALLPASTAMVIGAVFAGWNALYALAPGTFASHWKIIGVLSDLAQVVLPITFLVGLLRTRLRRAAVGSVVIEIGMSPTPRRLRDVVADVLNDESLQLGLWQPQSGGYIDTDGRPLALPAGGTGRSATLVNSHGTRWAVVVHDASLEDDPTLLRAVVSSIRLGLENAWLRSEVTAKSQEAGAVGARIMQAADRERRRLERDLHDGAQQRLVYASMALARIGAKVAQSADPALRDSVAEAGEALRLALAELRELAQGIHPAVLTREGLRPAIIALAERTAVPVVVAVEADRHPPLIEATAYFTVCEALANVAKHSQAQAVSVAARKDDGRLVVEVVDDGIGGADPTRGTGLRGLVDRLAAAGGTLQVVSAAGSGTRLRAVLPC